MIIIILTTIENIKNMILGGGSRKRSLIKLIKLIKIYLGPLYHHFEAKFRHGARFEWDSTRFEWRKIARIRPGSNGDSTRFEWGFDPVRMEDNRRDSTRFEWGFDPVRNGGNRDSGGLDSGDSGGLESR